MEDELAIVEAAGLTIIENVEIESPSIIFIVDDLEEFLTICELQGAEEVYVEFYGSFYCFDEGFIRAWRFTSETRTLASSESYKAFSAIVGLVIAGAGALMLIKFSAMVISERPKR